MNKLLINAVKSCFDDDFEYDWKKDKERQYDEEERWDKTSEYLENSTVWSYVTLVTDGHDLYGVSDYKDFVKRYNYDESEYEEVLEYRFGSYDEYDDTYVDSLMDETSKIIKPYIDTIYKDVRQGKYNGYFKFNIEYSVVGS